MSRRGSKHTALVTKEHNSLLYHLIEIVLGLPRFARIVMAALFGVAVTAASFPIVDRIYLSNFFSEQTTVIPSLVSAGFGLVMYVTGWMILVGTRGSQLPKRSAVLIYIITGVAVVIFVLVLVVNGYFSVTASDV